jgi:hypothetical protein
VCIGVLCWAYSTGGAVVRRKQQVPDAPKVISKVKLIEIISTTVKSDPPMLSIVVRNNSDKAVVSIAVESGDQKDSSGLNISGFRPDGQPPLTVIEPHGTRAIEFELDNILPNKPFKVGGVMYADGTEDGDKDTLETMHGDREHDEGKKPPQHKDSSNQRGGERR